MYYGYGNPFESRCALCGKNLGLFGPEWELCDKCSKIKFESEEKKERKKERKKNEKKLISCITDKSGALQYVF